VELQALQDKIEIGELLARYARDVGSKNWQLSGGRRHHDLVRTPEGWRSEGLVEENLSFVNPPPR